MRYRSKNARGYELYGGIAVIETAPKAARAMAQKLMRPNKVIKTVLRKGGAVSGRFRTRKFVYVAGRRNYLADYKENGCEFRFDMRKVFFSTKLSFERKRVSELVKDGEHVVVMFAGVGPFAIEIAKLHRKCKVVAIEANSTACRYMRENTKLNKTPNVIVENGDVSSFAKRYAGFADRIVMPLPMESKRFLPVALVMGKRSCKLHLYSFCRTDEVKEEIELVRGLVESKGRSFKLVSYRVARPYSAKEIEIAVDFSVN